MWSDFNAANRTAMMKSELISWPVTLAILLLAFGSLVAAGLPLMLTILGLVASAGLLARALAGVRDLDLGDELRADVRARARDRLRALRRPPLPRARSSARSSSAREAVAVTMDTAGKAVLFSGLTVLISLSAVMLVPSPAFRSMALGIMLSVVFVLAATLTLLPAVLAKLGPRVDRLALRWVHSGEHRSARFAAWGELLWRRPWLFGSLALAVLLALALPIAGLRTGMPSIKVVPDGRLLARRLHAGAAGVRARRARRAPDRRAGRGRLRRGADRPARRRHRARAPRRRPARTGSRSSRRSRAPTRRARASAARSTACAQRCPRARSSAAPWPRTTTSRPRSATRTPLVIGVVLALGFLLLLVALQAPLIAAAGVLTNLLATGAAFGVARLVFQDGHGAGLLGFESQGFLDAWGPVFFFAMIFAISMDYTVFLLSSAKEHFDRSGDPHEAMVGGLAHSGRVIFAAAAVMVAVFFTFALSGPLPPKEMGVILGVAVLLDALLIRLVLMPVLLRLLGRARLGACRARSTASCPTSASATHDNEPGGTMPTTIPQPPTTRGRWRRCSSARCCTAISAAPPTSSPTAARAP